MNVQEVDDPVDGLVAPPPPLPQHKVPGDVEPHVLLGGGELEGPGSPLHHLLQDGLARAGDSHQGVEDWDNQVTGRN